MYRGFLLCLFVVCVFGAPVVDKKKLPKDTKETEAHENMGDEDLENLEYNRYLQEVVNILESHPEFKAKLESEDPEYIKSGKIADHLDDMIPRDLRDKLSEAKLKEVERLREMYRKKIEIEGAQNIQAPDHIDHMNLNTFEKEDLKKLIQKTTNDLEELDKRREVEFKQYEMKKEVQRRKKLAEARTEEERQRLQKEFQAADEEHKKHPKVHHPGSKDQLEEVWEETDEMKGQDFQPRTFFNLHDLDGNGLWDEHELNALFQKELDKVYNESDPNDDPRERIEEMERMKVHVLEQMDKNKDRMISLEEFLQDTQTEDYKKDEGWDTLDQQQVYSPDEYKRYQEELAKQNGWQMPQDGYPDFYPPEGYVGQPQAYHPGQQAQQFQGQPHPGQISNQQFQGQVPNQQQFQGQVPNQQQFQGQVPPGQVPNQQQFQSPPGQVQLGQVPNQQQIQGQAAPRQVNPGQVPPGGQQQINPGQGVPAHPNQQQAQQVPTQPGQVGQGQQGQVPNAQAPVGQQVQGQAHPNAPQQGQAGVGQH